MRKDMSKVIVERPRFNSRAKNDYAGEVKQWQKGIQNDDFFPKRISTSRKRRYQPKELNENLAPLRKFLLSRVGQNWNKVYSEIREGIKVDSAVQLHILQHLSYYVAIDVKIWEDGAVTDSKGAEIYDIVYVNPKTMCLCENKNYHRRYIADKKEAKYVKIKDKNFRQLNDIWYEVQLQSIQPENKRVGLAADRHYWFGVAYDVILKKRVSFDDMWREHGAYRYSVSKRQLNSKEIKRYGLRTKESIIPTSPSRR